VAIIRSRSFIGADGSIPLALIASCIKEHQAGLGRLGKLDDYYYGRHEILKRIRDSENDLPNNKLVANHAKYITDIVVGYLVGDPVKYEGSGVDPIKKVYDQIDIVSHDTELAKDLSIFGEGRELYYMSSDESPIPKATVMDPRQIFLVVDDTVEYKSMFGVHYYERKDIDNKVIGYHINVYTELNVIRYESEKLDGDGYVEVKLEPHYFAAVPVVEFWNNEERQGDFEHQISLIDAYNVLMSDRINDKEQLVDAMLAVYGASFGDTTAEAVNTVKELKKLKVLELPLEGKAEWLIKNLTESDVEILKNAIRTDIHQFAMVPNLTDENFAANASGVAMKYKLFGLEQLAKVKERYFIQGLRERLKIFANVLKIKAQAVGVSDVKITMTRSLPSNDLEVAQMITNLSSNVSNKTLISQLSFIEDAEAEDKAVEAQKDVEIERNRKAFDMPFEDVKDDEQEE
jgi:SPP1 family phage portal protein